MLQLQQSGPEVHPVHATGAESRAAPRFRLMMRTSKLAAQTGEFLCVVRDISQSGVRLRLFHPLPEGDLALELGNGERHRVGHVWHANGEAGFRFAEPVDVDAFIAEPAEFPKRAVRLRMAVDAVLYSGGMTSSVQLEDISQQGAKIRCSTRLETGQIVSLSPAGEEPAFARVRWGSHPRYGLVFERAFRLDELAAMVWRWQESGQPSMLRAAG